MNKIDLSKNQLVEGDVKVWYWNECKEKANTGYLAIIDHRNGLRKPFFIWGRGLTGKDQGYNYDSDTIPYRNVELIEPKYRVKDFYSLVETLKEEGYFPYEKNDTILLKKVPEQKDVKILNWKKLFADSMSRAILRDEYIKENNIQETWLEEVTE